MQKVPTAVFAAVRRTGVMECRPKFGLLRLDVGRPDDLAPFLGFIGDELAEVGGRERERDAAQVGEPRFDLGIGKRCVDFLVELIDDFGWRVLGRAEADTTKLASKPGRNSPTVGMSGSASERAAVVTANARNLPALMYSIDGPCVAK